jgi:pseudouridine-5'-phosphate glycosidase
VVALESTILSHGLPWPRNLEVGQRIESIIRDAGAVPATIAILDGVPRIGLSAAELERVCDPSANLAKVASRDLGPVLAAGGNGATTVSATSVLASAAGIKVFATGGLGGVHRAAPGEANWDVSADLEILANTRILVVASGVKSILDVGATLEVLETKCVPVLGFGTDKFPLFYLPTSEFDVPWRVDTAVQAAKVAATHWNSPAGGTGVVLANPIPAESQMAAELHAELLAGGLRLLQDKKIRGKHVTPALLEYFHANSGGVSLDANEALVLSNSRLAAQVAVELAK